MERKIILVYRDRPRLEFLSLLESGILAYWANSPREAREQFDRLAHLEAIVVDVQENVERGLEFCEIVHAQRPDLPVVFIRSSKRLTLVPHCAHRALDPEVNESQLAREIFQLLNPPAASPNRKKA